MNKIINKIIFGVSIDSKQVVKSVYVITEKSLYAYRERMYFGLLINIGQPVFTLIMKIRL